MDKMCWEMASKVLQGWIESYGYPTPVTLFKFK